MQNLRFEFSNSFQYLFGQEKFKVVKSITSKYLLFSWKGNISFVAI